MFQPIVQLARWFDEPYDVNMAAAKNCYSSQGIASILPGCKSDLIEEIFNAGHHTVLEHTYFTFTLENISRHFVWSFLHSHPFYNSEQVSQRYVEVNEKNYVVPPLDANCETIYQETINFQMQQYQKLTDMLQKLIEAETECKSSRKRAMEIARYVLPIGTTTHLYHTISLVTLLRYWWMRKSGDLPTEQTEVIKEMVQLVLTIEPRYAALFNISNTLIGNTDTVTTCKYGSYQNDLYAKEFDLSLNNHNSKLVNYGTDNEQTVSESVREVCSRHMNVSNEFTIALAFMKKSKGSLNTSTMQKLDRCLSHATYTFKKKISHTADSQDQRHRTVMGSRPNFVIPDNPDYITPLIIVGDREIKKEYDETMKVTWEGISNLRKHGVPSEFTQYLLPNAVSIRFSETGNLLNLRHKYAMRLCYNAQEEIWRVTLDEVNQIRRINPIIGKYLLPPCTIRLSANEKPYCPEGKRFCGTRVWEIDVENYERKL